MKKTDVENAGTIVLRFTAGWCGPCKAFAVTFAEVAKDYPTVLTLPCNVDEGYGELASELNVRGIPCTVFFKDGQEVGRLNGSQPTEVVKTEFEKLK